MTWLVVFISLYYGLDRSGSLERSLRLFGDALHHFGWDARITHAPSPVTLHFYRNTTWKYAFEKILSFLVVVFFPPPLLVLCASKCQMFAFLMRARHWRGWMRGSRTPWEPRCAGTFSADPTGRRYGGIWRRRCRKMWRLSGRGITSTRWRSDRWSRVTSSGRRTAGRRSSTSGRLTGASRRGERRSCPAGTSGRRGARPGRKTRQPRSDRGKDALEIQVIYFVPSIIEAVT